MIKNMDNLVDNGPDEEENVLEQPMCAYNVSVVSNIKLPNLELDDDSDFEGDEELEPLIYHPVLDQGKTIVEDYSSLTALNDDGTYPSVLAGIISTDKTSTAKPTDKHIHVKNEDVFKSPVEMAPLKIHEISNTRQGDSQHDIDFTKLTYANLAEIELDNAILSLAPSHSLNVSLSQDSSGLSDSNSSSSSLLGKLEETMSSLKEASELEDGQIQENLTELQVKTKDLENANNEPKTVKLDLRHAQKTINADDGQIDMPTNRCVLLRYGRSQFSTIDEDQENEDFRRRLKKQSELITLNKGKLEAAQSLTNGPSEKGDQYTNESGTCLSTQKMGEERSISGKELDRSLSNCGILNLGDSVDSMLENVNRIMCRGTKTSKDGGTAATAKPLKDDAIKKYVLKTQNSDEGCEEYVEKYVIYDQKTGKESCVSPSPSARYLKSTKSPNEETCSTGAEEHFSNVGIVSHSNNSVNLEMNTQLVDWTDVLQTERNDLSLKDLNCMKGDIKEEISDNIFTNTFLSASKISENNEEKQIKKKNSKPKKNILNTSKRKIPKTAKIDKTNSNSNKQIVNDKKEPLLSSEDLSGKTDCHTLNKTGNKEISPKSTTEKKSENQQLTDEKERIINHVGDKSESMNNSPNYDGDISHCNGSLEEDILDNVKEFKKEIRNSYHENGDLSDSKLSTDNIYRQLKYSNEKTIDNVINNKILDEKSMDVGTRQCLACHIKNPGLETPMKHDESVCVNNNHMIDINSGKKVVRKVKKTTRSRGTTANILNLRDANKTNPEKEIGNVLDSNVKHFEDLHNSNEANKENSVEDSNNNPAVDDLTSCMPQSPIVTAKNSKNRKKKKSKNKFGNDVTSVELVDESVNHVNNVQKKGVENFDSFWKEITQGGKETVLYDEIMSFEQNYVSVPDINKQLLVLKVPLESPGVCKANVNDSIYTFADQSNSDNYIGLVTLFVYLLQGSRREISLPTLDIPFDVVSLQQAHLDSELFLIVGIAENKNTYQQKTKRTKLGTNFFHAVSQFLNANNLDKILWKIWEQTEADVSRIQNSLPFNHIWRQVELKTGERCAIPGSGKLSTFINISPDTNALQRIYSLYPSLFVHTEDKSGNVIPEEYSWFHPAGVRQEYTCITVEDATSISPKHLSELLKRLRKESVEICGLRIGYSVKDHSLYMPTLSICINEFNAATANEGKLLLSDCEELKELAISFNTQENISVIMNGSPLLKYTINPQRSHRQVVQWFGPHYKDVSELKDMLTELKSTSKVSNNKNDKKKWAVGSCQCQLSLLNSFFSSAVLFISALVPSAFISFVISIALKKGLQLKMVYKTCCSVSQLGLPEDKGDVFCYSDNDKRKGVVTNRCMVSCILLLFSGKSAALRLLGLICKLTEILNNPLTGETLSPWMVDNLIKFKPSHNTNDNSCKLNSIPKEYFGVLHFNDHIKDLLSTSFKPPKQHVVEDLYSILSKVQINFSKPEINLMALLFYGDEILKDVPTILRIIFSDCTYECLNSWRQSVRCRPFAVKYQPPIEFLGTKYINSISKLQASNLVVHENFTPQWEAEVTKLHGSNAVLIMLKAVDKRTVNQINETISKYIISSKLDLTTSNYIAHIDTEYVFRLMFHFFEPNELHGDQLKDESQIPPFCLPDNHVLFTVLDNVLDTNLHMQMLIKKKLPEKDWEKILPYSDLPTTPHVYQFSPSSLCFPLQMLLRCEKSYAGVSFEYLPHNIQTIAKALARIRRMGFQMAALKFPSYEPNNGSCHVRAVFLREDAVFVLNKMVPELETNYPKLKFTFTDIVHGVSNFVHNEFKGASDCGGIFHCNYFALVNELNFEKEECFENRENREVEWNPQNCNFESGLWHVKKENVPLYITGSLMATTDEVSVIILSEPLLSGRYLGRRLPENCIFPEVLHVFESVSYRMIAGKTTMLSTEAAEEVVGVYNVGDKKKSCMVRLLSQEGGPFVVIALVGSCILSNFWLTIERKLDNEDALNVLKQHALVATTKKQVEPLMVSLFDKVVQNTKVVLKTRLS